MKAVDEVVVVWVCVNEGTSKNMFKVTVVAKQVIQAGQEVEEEEAFSLQWQQPPLPPLPPHRILE